MIKYLIIMKYYSAVKRKEFLTQAITCMSNEATTLSERSQAHREKHHRDLPYLTYCILSYGTAQSVEMVRLVMRVVDHSFSTLSHDVGGSRHGMCASAHVCRERLLSW
jgi:hypothetical protein